MKKFMSRSTRFLLNKLVGKKAVEDTIVRLARSVDSDLLMLAYHNMGILKWQDSHVSGEHFVIAGFLGERLKSAAPVLFDVGRQCRRLRRGTEAAIPVGFDLCL